MKIKHLHPTRKNLDSPFFYCKFFFTLLELFIALGLAAILLSVLGYYYRQVDWIGREIDARQARAFTERYLQNRLSDVFTKVPKNAFFFLGEPAPGQKGGTQNLLFSFDNCVRLDKQFAYLVTGRLYVDDMGRLILARWPAPKFWEDVALPPMKFEVLMEGVDDLSFEFYNPPILVKPVENEEQPNSVREEPPPTISPGWGVEWKQEWKAIPAIVSISIRRGEETNIYPFVLINHKQPISYIQ